MNVDTMLIATGAISILAGVLLAAGTPRSRRAAAEPAGHPAGEPYLKKGPDGLEEEIRRSIASFKTRENPAAYGRNLHDAVGRPAANGAPGVVARSSQVPRPISGVLA